MKKLMVFLLFAALMVSAAWFMIEHGKPPLECKRFVTYQVKEGDTLWDIASWHAVLNTHEKIYMPAFMESIKEANPRHFSDNRCLQPGDQIRIYYYVQEAANESKTANR